MKTFITSLLLLAVGNLVANCATIAWTNTSGGNWSAAANWSPNQVPGAADTAVITANGTYTVTFDASATIAGLTLGGSGGTQTFSLGANTLTLNGTANINSNGQFNFSGGSLTGTTGVIAGLVTWTGGVFAGGSTLTIATNGTLILDSGAGPVYGVLTNAGTIRLAGQDLVFAPCFALGTLINLPGALVDIAGDFSFDSEGGYGCGTAIIINQGVLRKSAGTGTSVINPFFSNSGVVDAESGFLNINGNGNDTTSGGTFVGAGTNLISSGTFTLNGQVTSSNLVLAGGTLAGTNGVIAGLLTWTGGSFAGNSTLTIATNGTLIINSGAGAVIGALTNAGTIRVVGADLSFAPCFAPGMLINLPGALVDIAGDFSIDSEGGFGCGTATLINQGVLRKSTGTGTSTISPIFNNYGLLDVQSGTVSLGSSYNLTNGTLNFGISSLANYGKIAFPGSPAQLAGAIGANLNSNYVPVISNSFTLISYSSYAGLFTSASLPLMGIWSTNYGPSSFSITLVDTIKLVFTIQPVNELTNSILAPVVVQVEDPSSNPVATNNVPITLSLNGSGIVNGTLAQSTDPSGKATFGNLSFTTAGPKTLLATSAGVASVTSVPFQIVPLIAQFWTNGGYLLQLNGTNGQAPVTIYASTNLLYWVPIYTNAPTNGMIQYLDSSATNYPARFYHILEQ
jgi:hypothetical protein